MDVVQLFRWHDIAIPKGLCFTAVVFFFLLSFCLLLFRRLIFEVTEWISTKLGHIYIIHLLLLLKNLVRLPRAFTPTGLGKTAFRYRLLILTEHINISATEHDINNRKKTYQCTGLPYMPLNLVNIGPQTDENGWRAFSHPYIFALGDTASLTAWTLYKRQQAYFGFRYVLCSSTSLQSRTTECRAGSRWALPCWQYICCI